MCSPHDTKKRQSKANDSKYMAEPCTNCGGKMVISMRGSQIIKKEFCSGKCRNQFHSRMQKRGAALLPYLMHWRRVRGSGDIGKACFTEINRMLDQMNSDEREAGRPRLDKYVTSKLSNGEYMDRRRDGAGCKHYVPFETLELAFTEKERRESLGGRKKARFIVQCNVCNKYHIREGAKNKPANADDILIFNNHG